MAYQETTSDYSNLSVVILSLFKLWMLSGVKQLINSTEKTFKGYEYTVTEFLAQGVKSFYVFSKINFQNRWSR